MTPNLPSYPNIYTPFISVVSVSSVPMYSTHLPLIPISSTGGRTCINKLNASSLFNSGHNIASTKSDREIAPNPHDMQSSKYIMLHFRFSILYLLKILHQLFDSEEIVALGAVLSYLIRVVVHINLLIKNVGMSLIVALVPLTPR